MASTAQHLADLAVALAERGHDVTVICSRRAYDQPERGFPKSESWRGVKIERIATTAFGKQAKLRRALDFASFIFFCCLRLLVTRRPDVVVALTSPPLISFIGACFARLRRAKFAYWVMDLNPDEAIAAGWLREGSLAARFLHILSRFSFRRAQKIIALDRFMRDRVAAKGISDGNEIVVKRDVHRRVGAHDSRKAADSDKAAGALSPTRAGVAGDSKLVVIPPWSHDEAVRFDPAGREKFRAAHGLTDKFVVMYSGNHSPCHPLDTLVGAAWKLSQDPRFVFLFVGGGSEFHRIQQLAKGHDPNLLCLTYQPLDELSASLSAADLHAVVMGDPFVGVIHPCKIYNILGVGAPVLYIGPVPSHLSEILDELASRVCTTVAHGDVDRCAAEIVRLAGINTRGESERYATASRKFGQSLLLPRLVAELERV